ncbi:MAG TPA: hypothetical protein VHF92_06950, partial [Geodermatophilus sp.]|nr:hypothetical protein [Geodermatophilus sp.]
AEGAVTTVDAVASTETPAVGDTVTLTATAANADAASVTWAQTAGPAVTLSGTTGPSVTFTAPAQPVTFTATVTGTGGTATDTITVTPQDQVVITAAELRTRQAEWRISGTAAITTLNPVSIHLYEGGQPGRLIGEATPEAAGDWTLRVRGGIQPNGATQVIAVSEKGGVSAPFTFSTRR